MDAETLFSVDRRFLTGCGVEKNTAHARELLGQAAELGHSLAKQLLETIPAADPAEVATMEEPSAALPAPGYYRHFKGNYYQVIDIAHNSETLEPMVVYRALYGEHKLWVRPATMWSEIVDKPEYHGPRFVPVCNDVTANIRLSQNTELIPVVDWALRHSKSSDIHRLPHWNSVETWGNILYHTAYLEQIHNSDKELPNRKVLLYFAYLHDSCRLNDGEDIEHGPRAAKAIEEIRETLLSELSDKEFMQLQKAIELHTTAQSTGDITIDCCFDSDRLDLGRVGIEPDPNRMASKFGVEVVKKGFNNK